MNMTKEEFEKKLSSIPSAEPDEIDLQMMADVEVDADTSTISLDSVIEEKEYSGKILLRIPKELHHDLAKIAKEEGVSLNQYCLYKLSRSVGVDQNY